MQNYDEKLDGYVSKESFRRWQVKEHNRTDEELLNQRKAELNRLVRKVIKEELDEFDRKIVELHWYKGLSKSRVAEILGVDRSTVHRHFNTINETVYEKLRYAVELIYGTSAAEQEKSIIKENSKTLCSHMNSDEISKRLKSLRAQQFITVEQLSEKTSVSVSRLKEIEKKGSLMTMAELKKITDYYKVSCNYIIFGVA